MWCFAIQKVGNRTHSPPAHFIYLAKYFVVRLLAEGNEFGVGQTVRSVLDGGPGNQLVVAGPEQHDRRLDALHRTLFFDHLHGADCCGDPAPAGRPHRHAGACIAPPQLVFVTIDIVRQQRAAILGQRTGLLTRFPGWTARIAETGEQGFSSSNFQIAFLGTPAATGTWELQFGGHHTAFANTYIDGQLAGATPSFRGVEPFGPFEMNGRENDPMAQEQAAFAAMLTALTSSELAAAKLDQTFTNIVVGPQKDDNFPIDREGVRAGDLTEDQKALVINAISTYAADIGPAEESEAILRRYEAELDETYIAFSGSPTMDQERDYVRIDGPSVWIEYSMQPGRSLPGIHPHSIWRDRESDYAGNAE